MDEWRNGVVEGWSLAHPSALFLLLLIPLLAVLQGKAGREGAVKFSSLHILKRLGPKTRAKSGGFQLTLTLLAAICAILALSRPQKVSREEVVTDSGIELILVIDVSRSMEVEDFKIDQHTATRLQAAKKVTRDFIKGRNSDRIGIVAFAGRPYLVSPLTLSKSWLEGPLGLGRVKTGMVEDGTAIGSAVAAATKRLDRRNSKSKVIVLVTDGKNNAGKLNPIEAAKLARTLGIKIYTIAAGTYGYHVLQTERGPIPLKQEYDEETLQSIASIANGKFFRAQDLNSLQQIFNEIDQMEKTEVKRRVNVEAEEWFTWPALGSIFFGLISLIGRETIWRRFP